MIDSKELNNEYGLYYFIKRYVLNKTEEEYIYILFACMMYDYLIGHTIVFKRISINIFSDYIADYQQLSNNQKVVNKLKYSLSVDLRKLFNDLYEIDSDYFWEGLDDSKENSTKRIEKVLIDIL